MHYFRIHAVVVVSLLALTVTACSSSHAISTKAVPQGLACQLVPLETARSVTGIAGLSPQPTSAVPGNVASQCSYFLQDPLDNKVVSIEVYRQTLAGAKADSKREVSENRAHLNEVKRDQGYYRTATVQLVDIAGTPGLNGAKFAQYSHERKYSHDFLTVNNGQYTVYMLLEPYTWVSALGLAQSALANLPKS